MASATATRQEHLDEQQTKNNDEQRMKNNDEQAQKLSNEEQQLADHHQLEECNNAFGELSAANKQTDEQQAALAVPRLSASSTQLDSRRTVDDARRAGEHSTNTTSVSRLEFAFVLYLNLALIRLAINLYIANRIGNCRQPEPGRVLEYIARFHLRTREAFTTVKINAKKKTRFPDIQAAVDATLHLLTDFNDPLMTLPIDRYIDELSCDSFIDTAEQNSEIIGLQRLITEDLLAHNDSAGEAELEDEQQHFEADSCGDDDLCEDDLFEDDLFDSQHYADDLEVDHENIPGDHFF